MRILALDFGTKNIGAAVSDLSHTIAIEIDSFSPSSFWKGIVKFLNEKDISKILIGWPIGLNGQETQETKRVQLFVKKLQGKTRIPIDLVDERFTTEYAKRLRGGAPGHHDSLVAQIILQEYLDKNERI